MSMKFPVGNRKTTTAFRDLVIISAIFILVSVLVDVFRVFATFQEWVREQPQWSEWRIHDYLFTLVILALALGVFSLRRWIELRREIADRKQAEEALRESEERFTAFMNNSPVVAWLKDPATWTYRYINKAFAEVFDITPEVISKKTDFDLWPEEIARQLRENDLRVMSSDRTIQTSEDVPLPNGTVHHWLVFKFPLRTRSGKPFLAGTAVDITERRRMEEEREKIMHDLQDAFANVRTLSGLLPICASCKKIRDDKGYWNQIEGYIMTHSEATFSHGVCPECMKKLYPEFIKKT